MHIPSSRGFECAAIPRASGFADDALGRNHHFVSQGVRGVAGMCDRICFPKNVWVWELSAPTGHGVDGNDLQKQSGEV